MERVDSKHRSRLATRTLIALVTGFASAAIGVSPAQGLFTRPYLGQITQIPGGTPIPGALRLRGYASAEGKGAVASDPLTETIYVIGEGGETASHEFVSSVVDEFTESGQFVAQFTGEGHFGTGQGVYEERVESIAIASATDTLYAISGGQVLLLNATTGAYEGQWSGISPHKAHIAVDNSTDPSDPSSGDVYVDEEFGGVRVFKPNGTPVNFTGTASYIVGNMLIGPPEERFASFRSPGVMVVDGQGNIYVAAQGSTKAVHEFDPEGIFLRSFTAEGFGVQGGSSNIEGVAVDPINGHVLIVAHEELTIKENGEWFWPGSVYEFEATGKYLNKISRTTPEGDLGWPTGIEVSGNGTLFSGDKNADAIDIFGEGAFLPDVLSTEATSTSANGATLNGLVNPEGVALNNCHFEYVTDADYSAHGTQAFASSQSMPCTPATGEVPVDSKYHAVHANLTGLASGVAYRYRLVATSNPSELGGTASGEAVRFVAAHAPAIDAENANELSSQFAQLRAQIDPLGSDTSYQFQYVAQGGYAPAEVNPYAAGGAIPVSPVDIGSGGVDVSVEQQLGGLSPGTIYHFRVIARNGIGETVGTDHTFTTLPVDQDGLSDARAYELVTPANKNGAEDMFGAPGHTNYDVGYASESGDAFLLYTGSSFGGFPGSGEKSYVFARNAQEWVTQPLASPGLGVQSIATEAYDRKSFETVGIRDIAGSGGNPASEYDLTLVGPPGGQYVTMSETSHLQAPVSLAGASADLGNVVLETSDHELAPGASSLDEGSSALYDWSGGHLSLINVNTNGALISRCGAILGSGGPGGVTGSNHGAVSRDGSKVVFTAPDPYANGFHCWNEGAAPQVYLREEGKTTTEVSAPEVGVNDPRGMQPAVYVGASEDGSKIFFATQTELTADDVGHQALELYEYDTQAPDGKRLTRVSRGHAGDIEGNVAFVPAISPDGSTVYFAAWGTLAPGAPAVTPEGEEVNLYRYDTTTGETAYIATVSSHDYPNTNITKWYHFPNRGSLGLDVSANWYTTGNGRFLLFGSRHALTGYDSTPTVRGNCPDLNGTGAETTCTELYRYDAGTNAIMCVSCDPNDAAPLSNAEFARSAVRADNPAGSSPRPISEDGERVFFDTLDPLVARDTNGMLDVYEWHAGTVSLISSGNDAADSFFLDADPSGANVFFGTHARLVPQDTDTAGDIYDARIGGGFATVTGTAPCEGDACARPQPAVIDSTPTSAVFSGPVSAMSPVYRTATKKKHKKTSRNHQRKRKRVRRAGRGLTRSRNVRGHGRTGK